MTGNGHQPLIDPHGKLLPRPQQVSKGKAAELAIRDLFGLNRRTLEAVKGVERDLGDLAALVESLEERIAEMEGKGDG